MIIGEAPGKEEDELGIPFIGRSGKLLDEALSDGKTDKEGELYVTNLVKCRPPDNRNPTKEEINACIPYLYEQIKAVNPDTIITLGRVPFEALMGSKASCTLTRLINKSPYYYEGYALYAMYHPSYILRAPSNKELWIEKMQEIINEVL